MQTTNWNLLIPLIVAWVVSAVAGVSFLRDALKDKTRPPARGWRKMLRELRFRLSFAAGVGLLLWVLSGVIWVLAN